MRIEVEEYSMGFRVRLRSDDRQEFAYALVEFKRYLPEALRLYRSESRYWHVERRGRRYLLAWMEDMRQEFCANVEWLEDDGEPGSNTENRSTANEQPQDPLARVYATLHLLPSAPIELVKAAPRVLAKKAHPDAGGNVETMERINTAVDLIETVHRQREAA